MADAPQLLVPGTVSAPPSDFTAVFIYKNCHYGVDIKGQVWQRHLAKIGWINVSVTVPDPAP